MTTIKISEEVKGFFSETNQEIDDLIQRMKLEYKVYSINSILDGILFGIVPQNDKANLDPKFIIENFKKWITVIIGIDDKNLQLITLINNCYSFMKNSTFSFNKENIKKGDLTEHHQKKNDFKNQLISSILDIDTSGEFGECFMCKTFIICLARATFEKYDFQISWDQFLAESIQSNPELKKHFNIEK